MSRSREGPREFLKSFRGTLQTDAYSATNPWRGSGIPTWYWRLLGARSARF